MRRLSGISPFLAMFLSMFRRLWPSFPHSAKHYGKVVKKIIVSVPNCMRGGNATGALRSRETINSDHCFEFSPFTLAKVMTLSGFHIQEFYYSTFTAARFPKSTHLQAQALFGAHADCSVIHDLRPILCDAFGLRAPDEFARWLRGGTLAAGDAAGKLRSARRLLPPEAGPFMSLQRGAVIDGWSLLPSPVRYPHIVRRLDEIRQAPGNAGRLCHLRFSTGTHQGTCS